MKDDVFLDQVKSEWRQILADYAKLAKLKSGALLVVGCSTSEVRGQRIGQYSNQEIGTVLFEQLARFANQQQIECAVQCCEHLNRALVIERSTAQARGYAEVNVVPVLHAGGAFAVAAYQGMQDPIVVETIQADGAIDIGDTLIGMHLRPVAVPLRLSLTEIGKAHVTAARTRAKCIGGARAQYNENLK